jgi:hypothetical protein
MRNVLPLSPMTADEYEKLPSEEKEHFCGMHRIKSYHNRRVHSARFCSYEIEHKG